MSKISLLFSVLVFLSFSARGGDSVDRPPLGTYTGYWYDRFNLQNVPVVLELSEKDSNIVGNFQTENLRKFDGNDDQCKTDNSSCECHYIANRVDCRHFVEIPGEVLASVTGKFNDQVKKLSLFSSDKQFSLQLDWSSLDNLLTGLFLTPKNPTPKVLPWPDMNVLLQFAPQQ